MSCHSDPQKPQSIIHHIFRLGFPSQQNFEFPPFSTTKSTMSFHSEPQKPQSIIHHIGRLGLKLAKSLSSHKSANSLGLDSIPRLVATADHGDHSGSSSVHENCAYDSADKVCDESIQESFHGSLNDCIAEEIFETLDQNHFLIECFMSNERSDITFLVHFFNEDSTISDEIEEHVSRLVRDSASRCQCRRVNARRAPLFTGKLGIDPEQPTLVSIQNGAVIEKLSNFSSSVRSEVEEWITVKDILNQLVTGSFSNLCTDF
jgi:hypothetical protein